MPGKGGHIAKMDYRDPCDEDGKAFDGSFDGMAPPCISQEYARLSMIDYFRP